jgi:hypothetical protein
MKKLLTLVVLLSAMTLTARAQGVHFGVKGGIDVTDMSFSEKVFNTSNRLGWLIGPSLQIEFPMSGFGIDIAGLYDQKSTEVNDQTIKMKSVLVPLNLHFRIGFGRDAGIYLAAGPRLGFNVGDDEFKWNADGVENTFQLKKSSLSANIGAGFYIAGCWEVGVTYNIALGKTGDATFNSVRDGIKEDDGKSRTWQLSASYYF